VGTAVISIISSTVDASYSVLLTERSLNSFHLHVQRVI